MSQALYIGVVGYREARFDTALARRLIRDDFMRIAYRNPSREVIVVVGLIDVGVAGIAYREAKRHGWKTIGVACKKARAGEYVWLDAHEWRIAGENWGDELEVFLSDLHLLIRIGSNWWSQMAAIEARARGLSVLDYELPKLV